MIWFAVFGIVCLAISVALLIWFHLGRVRGGYWQAYWSAAFCLAAVVQGLLLLRAWGVNA